MATHTDEQLNLIAAFEAELRDGSLRQVVAP